MENPEEEQSVAHRSAGSRAECTAGCDKAVLTTPSHKVQQVSWAELMDQLIELGTASGEPMRLCWGGLRWRRYSTCAPSIKGKLTTSMYMGCIRALNTCVGMQSPPLSGSSYRYGGSNWDQLRAAHTK